MRPAAALSSTAGRARSTARPPVRVGVAARCRSCSCLPLSAGPRRPAVRQPGRGRHLARPVRRRLRLRVIPLGADHHRLARRRLDRRLSGARPRPRPGDRLCTVPRRQGGRQVHRRLPLLPVLPDHPRPAVHLRHRGHGQRGLDGCHRGGGRALPLPHHPVGRPPRGDHVLHPVRDAATARRVLTARHRTAGGRLLPGREAGPDRTAGDPPRGAAGCSPRAAPSSS